MNKTQKASVLQKRVHRLRRQEEEKRAQGLAKKTGLSYVNLALKPIEAEAVSLLAKEEAKNSQTAVIKALKNKVWLAVLKPKNLKTQKIIQTLQAKGYQVNLLVVSQHSLEKAWQAYEALPVPEKEITGQVQISSTSLGGFQKEIQTLTDIQEKIKQLLTKEKDLSVLIEMLIAGALKTEASDIHLEKKEKEALIRYRIDGVLHDVVFLSNKIYQLLLSRIKLLSGMKLNVKDTAQDGRFTIQIKGRELEVRAACIPGAYGENVVLRILDPSRLLDLDNLGLRKNLLAIIDKEIRKPNGMLIITGPTGSGKTTSLYAFLKKIAQPTIKIITLEDPIEYHLPNIIQTQIDKKEDYTFVAGLQAALRQDPDVILIGEIRDAETAQVALRAASTGHLVFSTLHTNDAASAIPYLIELGSKPTFLSSSLNVVMAQRLVRKICPQCQKTYQPSSQELAKIKKGLKGVQIPLPALNKSLKLSKGKGCGSCLQTGYKGRIGIFEMILITQEMEKLINISPSHIQVKEEATKQGLVTMYQDGLIKVLQKITTIEEVEKVALQ